MMRAVKHINVNSYIHKNIISMYNFADNYNIRQFNCVSVIIRSFNKYVRIKRNSIGTS